MRISRKNPFFSYTIYGSRKSDAFNWLENTMSDLKIGKKEPFTPIGVVTRNSNVFQFPSSKLPKVENPKLNVVSSGPSSKATFEETKTSSTQDVVTLRHQLPQAFMQQSKAIGDPRANILQHLSQQQSPQSQMNQTISNTSFSPSNQQLDQIQQLNQQVHMPHSQNFGSMLSQQPNPSSFKQWPMRMPGKCFS